jgi:hypothetical protein
MNTCASTSCAIARAAAWSAIAASRSGQTTEQDWKTPHAVLVASAPQMLLGIFTLFGSGSASLGYSIFDSQTQM